MKSLFTYIAEMRIDEMVFSTTPDDYKSCLLEIGKRYPDLDVSENSKLGEFIKLIYNQWNNRKREDPNAKGPIILSDKIVDNPKSTDKKIKVLASYRADSVVTDFLSRLGATVESKNMKTSKIFGINLFWSGGRSAKVNTDSQESITAEVINKFARGHKEIGVHDVLELIKDKGVLKTDSSDIELALGSNDDTVLLKHLINDDRKWIQSWVGQYNTLATLLKSKGWKNVKAARYDSNTTDTVVSKLIELHKSFMSVSGLHPKDSVDPSDIVVYDNSKVPDIIKVFDDCIDKLKLNQSKAEENKEAAIIEVRNAFRNLYRDNLYIGVSLKKDVSFRPFFINETEKPESFEDTRLNIIAFDPVGSIYKNGKYTKLTKDIYDEACGPRRSCPSKSCGMKLEFKEYEEDTAEAKGAPYRLETTMMFRTNQIQKRMMMVCESMLSGAMAQIGKANTKYWCEVLNVKNNDYEKFLKTAADQKDIYSKFKRNIMSAWKEVLQSDMKFVSVSKYNDLSHTIDDVIDIIENNSIGVDMEKRAEADDWLWSTYNQIFILREFAAASESRRNSMFRRLLLLCEKEGSRCLPYLLIRAKLENKRIY